MKVLTAIIFALALTVNAQASSGATVCSNGNIEDIGDQHMEIVFNNASIEFNPYEASFSVSLDDVKMSDAEQGTTYSVVNQSVEVSEEGETAIGVYNIIMTRVSDSLDLQVAISRDFAPFHSLTMKCK